MAATQKRCRYCKCLFTPEPNIKNPIACRKALCRRAREQEARERWNDKNPNYYKGRYPNTKRWRKKHPDYLKRYRESHPEYVKENRIKQKERRKKAKCVDIQDE